ncbi:MAG: hypothetical protein AAFO15_00795 [Pseudomonadota bacterium]
MELENDLCFGYIVTNEEVTFYIPPNVRKILRAYKKVNSLSINKFEFLLENIPKVVLDNIYPNLMKSYMQHVDKHLEKFNKDNIIGLAKYINEKLIPLLYKIYKNSGLVRFNRNNRTLCENTWYDELREKYLSYLERLIIQKMQKICSSSDTSELIHVIKDMSKYDWYKYIRDEITWEAINAKKYDSNPEGDLVPFVVYDILSKATVEQNIFILFPHELQNPLLSCVLGLFSLDNLVSITGQDKEKIQNDFYAFLQSSCAPRTAKTCQGPSSTVILNMIQNYKNISWFQDEKVAKIIYKNFILNGFYTKYLSPLEIWLYEKALKNVNNNTNDDINLNIDSWYKYFKQTNVFLKQSIGKEGKFSDNVENIISTKNQEIESEAIRRAYAKFLFWLACNNELVALQNAKQMINKNNLYFQKKKPSLHLSDQDCYEDKMIEFFSKFNNENYNFTNDEFKFDWTKDLEQDLIKLNADDSEYDESAYGRIYRCIKK